MKKLKGKGLPTLLTKNAFSFHEFAQVPEKYKTMLKEDRAIDIICNIIEEKLKNTGTKNRLYFLISRTGSGKSTTFIYNLFTKFIDNEKCSLFTTEPRVPLCASNALEVVRWGEHGEEIGKNIGYITGSIKVFCESRETGQLYYCTPQILANKLLNVLQNKTIDPNNYMKIVVIDEAHLLDMPTLETLNIIYSILENFKNDPLCPLFVFTSATLNLEPFLNYFSALFNPDSEIFLNKNYEANKTNAYESGFNAHDFNAHDFNAHDIYSVYENLSFSEFDNTDDLRVIHKMKYLDIKNIKFNAKNTKSLSNQISQIDENTNFVDENTNFVDENEEKIKELLKDYSLIGFVNGSSNFKTSLKYASSTDIKQSYKNTIANIKDPIKDKNLYIINYSKFIAEYIIKKFIGLMFSPVKDFGNDLLLFVPKSSIINSVITSIKEILEKIKVNKKILPVFGVVKQTQFSDVITWREQNKGNERLLLIGYGRGFAPASDELLKTSFEKEEESRKNERKIFVSTPIIETGKTIASLRYCVDTGLELKPCPNPLVYNPYKQIENLKLVPINQSAATQRFGRIGREQEGEALRFYTSDVYENLEKDELPETINNYCLSAVLLSKLQTFKPLMYYDIFNDNNYLFKISLDIQIRTVIDLINSGFYNIFGYICPEAFNIDRNTILINYVNQLYYIKNYSLFESLLVINLNMKFLSNELTPTEINPDLLQIKIKDLPKKPIEYETVEVIKKVRNIITMVKYETSYETFKYLYNRLF